MNHKHEWPEWSDSWCEESLPPVGRYTVAALVMFIAFGHCPYAFGPWATILPWKTLG